MIETLGALDAKLFQFLNGLHAEWFDPVMYYASKTEAWLPLHLVLLYYIFKHHKKDAWVILLGVALTITLADQITSTLMKPYFARLRPSWEPALSALLHVVDGDHGGKFGFPSSHAANTFGTAMFLWLVYRPSWMVWLFLWAAFVSYSRIYLGVHYPGDIIVGAIIGMCIGWALYKLTSETLRRKANANY
ncbi:MAG: phosphatase PAP2 family protein [Chryseolinea sp.]